MAKDSFSIISGDGGTGLDCQGGSGGGSGGGTLILSSGGVLTTDSTRSIAPVELRHESYHFTTAFGPFLTWELGVLLTVFFALVNQLIHIHRHKQTPPIHELVCGICDKTKYQAIEPRMIYFDGKPHKPICDDCINAGAYQS